MRIPRETSRCLGFSEIDEDDDKKVNGDDNEDEYGFGMKTLLWVVEDRIQTSLSAFMAYCYSRLIISE